MKAPFFLLVLQQKPITSNNEHLLLCHLLFTKWRHFGYMSLCLFFFPLVNTLRTHTEGTQVPNQQNYNKRSNPLWLIPSKTYFVKLISWYVVVGPTIWPIQMDQKLGHLYITWIPWVLHSSGWTRPTDQLIVHQSKWIVIPLNLWCADEDNRMMDGSQT